MAAPAVLRTRTTTTSGQTSHSVLLPATVNADETGLAIWNGHGVAVTPPSGWTKRLEVFDTDPSGPFASLGIATRDAAFAGTEDGATVVFTTGSAKSCCFHIVVLDSTADLANLLLGAAAAGFGVSDTLSAPSLTTLAADTLALALASRTNWAGPYGQSGQNSTPSGYSATIAVGGADSGTGDITTGLTHKWALDESGSTTTAADSVGSSDGTLTNFASPSSAWQASGGVHEGALLFDGVNDRIAIPSMNLGSTGSISLWIKPDSSLVNAVIFANKSTGNTADGFALFGNANGKLTFNTANGTLFGNPESVNGAFALNAWNHIVITWNKTGPHFLCYANGVFTNLDGAQEGAIRTDFNTNGAWSLGALNDAGTPYKGYIDDVRVFSRALSATDVKALYRERGWATFVAQKDMAVAGATGAASFGSWTNGPNQWAAGHIGVPKVIVSAGQPYALRRQNLGPRIVQGRF